MLFVNNYKPKRGLSEKEVKRAYNLFLKWERPEGVKVIAHYHTGVCRGVEILDANSPEEIIEFDMPWIPYLEADIRPAIDSDAKIVEVAEKTINFWESVK